jgi:hypothetical protein
VALAAGLIVCCACSGSSTSTVFPASRLPKLVLQPPDAPPGSQLLPDSSGPQDLDKVVAADKDAAAEKSALQRDGFEGGYSALFVSPNVPAAGGASLMRLITSAVALFPDAAAAHQAVQVLATTAEQGQDITRFDAGSLGDDAVGLRTVTKTVVGNDYAFIWRSGPLALATIVATDSTAVDPRPATGIAAKVATAANRYTQPQPDDLAHIALQPSDSPAGTEYSADRSGPKSADAFAGQPAEAAQLKQLGFRGGFQSTFVAKDLPAAGNGQAGARLIASFAQLYRTAAGAKRAYDLQVGGRLRLVGKGLSRLKPHDLGDQVTGFSFTSSQNGADLPGVLYAWRRGNAVFALYAFGPRGTVDERTVAGLAAKVDDAAKRAA